MTDFRNSGVQDLAEAQKHRVGSREQIHKNSERSRIRRRRRTNRSDEHASTGVFRSLSVKWSSRDPSFSERFVIPLGQCLTKQLSALGDLLIMQLPESLGKETSC